MDQPDTPAPHVLAKSFCRQCAAVCGIVVATDGTDPQMVDADRDHPRSQGYTCPKGRRYMELHSNSQRLSHPMVRGRQVSWEEAMDDLAADLRAILEEDGPNAIGDYWGTGYGRETLGLWVHNAFFAALGTTQRYSAGTVDVAPMLRVAHSITGMHTLFPLFEPDDERGATLVLFVGQNPLVSHGFYVHGPSFSDPRRRLKNFQRRGGEIWVVDPRRTETAALADHHLAVAPGSDGMLLAWLVRELMSDDACEKNLLAHCDEVEVARLRDAVTGVTLSAAAAECGLDPGSMLTLLETIRRHGRFAVVSGTGVSFGRHAVATEWLCWVLLIMTDSLDREGGMSFGPPRRQRPGSGAPLRSATWNTASSSSGERAPGPASRPDLRNIFGEIPSAAIADEIEAGNLRALFLAGANLLTALPDPARTKAALAKADVVVAIDAFAGPHVDLASHICPSTWHLERSDFVVYEHGSYYTPAMVPPGGDRRGTWWVYVALAERLGIDLFPGSAVDLSDEESAMRSFIEARGWSAEEVIAAGPHGRQHGSDFGWVRSDVLLDGRWPLAPAELVNELPQRWTSAPGSTRLVSNRSLRNQNSFATHSDGPPPIAISPADARNLGIEDGAAIEVYNDHGAVIGPAAIDGRLQAGVVAINHGWFGQNVANLTDAHDLNPLTCQPVMTDIEVRVRGAANEE